MKKLMIAAAIVCAAAMSQAAAVSWYWSGTVYDGYNNNGEGYTKAAQAGKMYIFNALATGVTQQKVLDAVLADLALPTSLDSYTSEDGKLASSGRRPLGDHTDFSPVKDGAEGGKVADFFYAMIITEGDNKYVFISDTYSMDVQTSKETKLYESLSTPTTVNKGETSTFTGGGWYTQAVPEPTSGLLLLLGVAGLALRRRRA